MCSTRLCNAQPRSRFSAGLRALGVLSLLPVSFVAGVAGCSSGSSPITRLAVAAPHLEAVDAHTMALRYREMGALRVIRYDEAGAADPGIAVTFSITGNSAGSTLASGRALTGDDGVAEMTVTAGI